MKIELKNVKYFAAGSQETSCFVATIYVDGKKIGTAENDGHGGNTNISPLHCWKVLNDYALTLPNVTSSIKNADDPTGFFTYEQTADSLVDDILADYLTLRDMKRLMTKRILFTKGGSDAVYETSVVKSEVMAKFRTDAEFRIKTITKLGAVCILNLLPEATALKLFNRGA